MVTPEARTVGAAKTYTSPYTDGQGYKYELELTVYPAVRGSDNAAMTSLWSKVRGTGSPPCLDADVQNDMAIGVLIHTDTSAYAFGTLTVKYLTTGFAAGTVQWWFRSKNRSAMGVGYSDGARCDGMGVGFNFSPTITTSRWGPVPVVFAYDGVYTPKSPQGDPAAITPVTLDQTILDATGKTIPGVPITLADAPTS